MATIIFKQSYADSIKENNLLNLIFEKFVEHFDTLEAAVTQIQYCKENYFDEYDYKLAQSAIIFASTPEIITMYKTAGYKDADKWSYSYLDFQYLHAVRDVANYILNERQNINKWK